MFHDFLEKLQITAIMCSVQEAPDTVPSNTDAMDRHFNSKQERDDLMKRGGLENATDEFIQCLIYRQMWDSDRLWKTAGEVKKEVRDLELKKEKESGLKDNIQMQYKGMG